MKYSVLKINIGTVGLFRAAILVEFHSRSQRGGSKRDQHRFHFWCTCCSEAEGLRSDKVDGR